MTAANKITMVRIFMIPIFIACAMLRSNAGDTAALILFCVASFTDFLDGFVARAFHQVTDFGKFVDPLADKLLVTAALLLFVERGVIAAWMVFIILAREFIITSLRNVAAAKGRVLAATWTGKVKTCVQIGGVIVLFLCPLAIAPAATPSAVQLVELVTSCVMTLVTLYAGIDYLVKNWDLIRDGASRPKAPSP